MAPVTDDLWTAVDFMFDGLLIPSDPALDDALRATAASGLPQIQVAPNQGKLLNLLAQAVDARSILEIGTLGGYSTIWLARALPPGGRLVTLEVDPKHADIARSNLERAGLSGVVDVRVGRALDVLPTLESGGQAPFDFVFIDADKPSTADYFTWAVKLSRRGGLIVVDNVVRHGTVLDPDSDDANVQGMRHFNDVLAGESRVSATVVQTVGVKGHDGFALALVVG